MNNSEIIGAKQTSQPFHKGEKEREKMEVEMGVGEKRVQRCGRSTAKRRRRPSDEEQWRKGKEQKDRKRTRFLLR